jgi:hypothetical protein
VTLFYNTTYCFFEYLVVFNIHIYIGLYKIVLILRRCVMAKSFVWERDMKKAIERSTAEQKPILLDFFSPG